MGNCFAIEWRVRGFECFFNLVVFCLLKVSTQPESSECLINLVVPLHVMVYRVLWWFDVALAWRCCLISATGIFIRFIVVVKDGVSGVVA